LDRVLEDAAAQLEFENRIRRDIMTSLTYPMFLVTAGMAAVGFLFYEVVPRFADMIGNSPSASEGLAGLVLSIGVGFRANAPLIVIGLVALIATAAAAAGSDRGRQAISSIARDTPVVSGLIVAHERATWSRMMAFALSNGLPLLEAMSLGLQSAPEGRFKRNLGGSIRSLRAGKRIDEALGEPGMLTALDLSLLRAGQRSGALGSMFEFIANRYEERLRQSIKRVTSLIEPLAIGFVAIAVGTVALGLVSAMSSVYESVL
jgi:general secretion pathway protein F